MQVTLVSSTICPAYMTATRSASSAMTPRSWVMRMTEAPTSLRNWRIRSRIWAWMVTSRAVVGSSAISRAGTQRQRHGDHDALSHATREFVREGFHPPFGVGDAHLAEHIHSLLPRHRMFHLLMDAHHLSHLVAGHKHRVEAGLGLLEDH